MAISKIRQLELPLIFGQREGLSHARTYLGGAAVSYLVTRNRRRRSITFTIDEHGLRVGAPWHAGHGAIEKLLHKHGDWVLKKLTEWQARRPPQCGWREGETLMMLGRPLRLAFAGATREIRLDDGRLILGPAWDQRPDVNKARIVDWLHEQALSCFRERAAHYAARLQIRKPEIRLSNGRTRWGSCHIDGRIRLNWRLIQMPLRLVDYVVAHELAHLVEMNHSPRFWKTVARVLPDYMAHRADLKTEGYRYLLV